MSPRTGAAPRTPRTIAIVGGGLAAGEAAKTLRSEGFDGRLVVVAEEAHAPYERPPLSKEYLRGEAAADKATVLDADLASEQRIELILGRAATDLDLHARRLTLADGSRLPFDGLLLATGATARVPVGPRPEWLHVLRTFEDADRIREAARLASSTVVAGGGWIAAETAASLRQLGLEVTLVVPGAEVLERSLGPVVGAMFRSVHESHGVRVVRGARVAGLAEPGPGLRLADGSIVAGDLVVVGFGAAPRTELAERAGLAVADGIVVDEWLSTAADGVLAAGDVASAWHPRYHERVRSEHWDNARRQARTAARNLLGRAESYERVPYFFSDQFDLGMEVVGRFAASDEVVVRRVDDDAFIAFWLRDDRLTAALHANVWGAKKTLERLVDQAVPVDGALLSDPAVPLVELAAAA
ncbi:MAG TPA: FAD-dependent oxidoreductase [Candidatus Limnocylindrales bacterium]|nr:FAD-dependent oxidoreductase [Candidatus Limnocylindrales bacterium]